MDTAASAASPAASRTSADVIALRLHAAGVRHAFGIPGGEVLALIDALERAGIRFVLPGTRTPPASWPRPRGTPPARRACWWRPSAPGWPTRSTWSRTPAGPGAADRAVGQGAGGRGAALHPSGLRPPGRAAPLVKASFEARAGACDADDRQGRSASRSTPGPARCTSTCRSRRLGRPTPARRRPCAGPARAAPRPRARRWTRPGAAGAAAERPVIVAGLDLLAEPGGPSPPCAPGGGPRHPGADHLQGQGRAARGSSAEPRRPRALSPKSDAIVLPLRGRRGRDLRRLRPDRDAGRLAGPLGIPRWHRVRGTPRTPVSCTTRPRLDLRARRPGWRR
jgi:acetolactate synthase I/II/III large subunit